MKYISGSYAQAQLVKTINESEESLTQEFLTNGPITSEFYQKYWRDRVIDASFGRNTVLFDDLGNPSVMVIINANTKNLLDETKGNVVHPAFIVDGEVIPKFYVSKYLNTMINNRPVSLKGLAPSNLTSFTTANTSTKNKGNGWHVLTNAEYAAIALQSWDSGFFPRGNTNHGSSDLVDSESGIPADVDSEGKVRYTLNGTGPISWSHDGTPYGVFDLTGNLEEFVTGFMFVDRQIRIIQDNDAAKPSADFSESSSLWKSVLSNGNLVTPNTTGSLGFIHDGSLMLTNSTSPYSNPVGSLFRNVGTTSQINDAPDILKLLAIFPKNDNVNDESYYYLSGTGMHRVSRGGSYTNYGGFLTTRAHDSLYGGSWTSVGFRTSFIEGM